MSLMFDEKFDFGSQESAIPASVNGFVTAVMRGTASESNENPHFKQASLTVSQLLAFNTTIRTRNQSLSLYHSRKREPPLPVYLAQMVHTKTRNLSIIRNLSKLGLCISKDQFAHVSVCMSNAVIEMNEQEGHVLPTNHRKGLFSTASVDNEDIETKSSTAFTSLNGTAASVNQHLSENFIVVSRKPMTFSNMKTFHLHTFHLYVISLHLMKMETFQPLKKIYSRRMRNGLRNYKYTLVHFSCQEIHLRQFQIYLPCFQYRGIIPSLLQLSNIFFMYWVQQWTI